jgi:hypothetical protein
VRLLADNLGAASLVLVTHDMRIVSDRFAVYDLADGVLGKR